MLMLWCCLPGKGPRTTVFSKLAFHGKLPVSKCSCVLQDLQVDLDFFAPFLQITFIFNGVQSFLWKRMEIELSAKLCILKCFSPICDAVMIFFVVCLFPSLEWNDWTPSKQRRIYNGWWRKPSCVTAVSVFWQTKTAFSLIWFQQRLGVAKDLIRQVCFSELSLSAFWNALVTLCTQRKIFQSVCSIICSLYSTRL